MLACFHIMMFQPRFGFCNPETNVHVSSAPILELRLAPPKQPQPQIAAELHILDASRDELEAHFSKLLEDSYERALSDAKHRIDSLIKRFLDVPRFGVSRRSGFMRVADSNSKSFGIHATVFPVPPSDIRIKARIDDLEGKLSLLEKNILQQACDDLPRITDLVLSELGAELHRISRGSNARRQSSFLELAPLANVRVASSAKPFPTVRDLVEKMEQRRSSEESAALSRAIRVETKLFKAELEYVTTALQATVSQ